MSSHWQPDAELDQLKNRARILQQIRAFFYSRQVLEVDTPVLSPFANTDPQIESFSVEFQQQPLYLHTSPEFFMKRLLAAGSGDIFQLCKVFRDDEIGRIHQPEFTLLEWYRLGFDHHRLMDEVQQLIEQLLPHSDAFTGGAKAGFNRLSYAQAFAQSLSINPHQASASDLHHCALQHQIEIPQGMELGNKQMWLDWLMSCHVSQQFAAGQFTFIYDYPATMAALARLDPANPQLAQRFELYYGELELANGFYELTDAQQQTQRFIKENTMRSERGQATLPMDQALLDALQAGLPQCAGVALGIDRLVMLMQGQTAIDDVISFTLHRP